MQDRTVSIGCAVAYGLWALSMLLLFGSWLVWDDHAADRMGQTALWAAAAAATGTVRCYFVAHNRLVRAAFELGRDGRGSVSTLH